MPPRRGARCAAASGDRTAAAAAAVVERRRDEAGDHRLRRARDTRGRRRLRARGTSASPSSTTTARCGCEQPIYVQLAFALDRVKALAPQHPEWKTKQPFKAVLRATSKAVAAAGEQRPPRASWPRPTPGMTTEEFDAIVSDWIATARHPKIAAALHRAGLPADARGARAICARTASRPSSSPAAASSSCGRGRSASTAFRPSRSSAAAPR